MKIKGGPLFLTAIMAVLLVVIISSLTMEHLESKLLPLLIGGIVLLLAIAALRREISLKKDPGESERTVDEAPVYEDAVNIRRYLAAGGWVLGFFLAIYLTGFIIAIPLFLLVYMKWHGTRWLTTIACAITIPALIYGLFEVVLRVNLYPGIFWARFG